MLRKSIKIIISSTNLFFYSFITVFSLFRLFSVNNSVFFPPLLQCCASPRSITVVVLMRDESGYMMLLLPFHQQRTPHKHTANTAMIPRDYPPDSDHPAPANWRFSSAWNQRTRRRVFCSRLRVKLHARIRVFFSPPALDAFFRAWLQGPAVVKPASLLKKQYKHPPTLLHLRDFGRCAASWGFDPSRLSVPWSPHQPGAERRKREQPLWPKPHSCFG